METTNKGAWQGFKDFFKPLPETYAQGSVASAGGTSPLIGVQPPARAAGPVLTPRTALGLNAVYRAVSIITTSVSQLPLDVQRAGQTIDTPALVSKPDVRTSQTEFLSLTAHSLATWGNAYWRLHRAVEGPYEAVSTVEVLNPELVYVDWVEGRKVYRYGDTTWADWQVKHLMINPGFVPGSFMVTGIGPVQANAAELQAQLELRDYAAGYFRNSGIPTGILSTTQELDSATADAYRARWYEVQAKGGIQVLGNGLTFQAVSLSPSDALFTEISQKAVTDTARMFGIPARYLLASVEGSSLTYSNMQDEDRTLIRYTLMQYAGAIEDAFTELLPRGQRARFNIDAFLRSDTKSRYEAHKLAIDAGFLTIDEVRALENLNPQTGDTPETT